MFPKCECGSKQPSFGLPGGILKWCKDCPNISPDAINLKSKSCECKKHQASYYHPDEKIAKWCAYCPNKPSIAISIRKKCACGKTAYFGFENQTAQWCNDCKKEGSINVRYKRCECGKRPTFGINGTRQALWCKNCKPDHAMDVRSNKCECGKTQPSLGLQGKIMKWCPSCPGKPHDAVNLKYVKCECGKSTPSYGYVHERLKRWCAKCPNKPKNAINLKNKLCPCNKVASYGLENDKLLKWCAKCPNKPVDAIDLRSKKCINEMFKEDPIKYWKCSTPVTTTKFNGYCLRCFSSLFPDDPLSKIHNYKENLFLGQVKQMMQLCFPNMFVSYDKVVPGGTSLRRPDVLIHAKGYVICIEHDEFQHHHDAYLCEEKRMMQIFQDCGNKPMILLRFNPDAYLDAQGIKKASCFKTRNGKTELINPHDWNERVQYFLERLHHHLHHIPEKELTLEFFYYDQCISSID